MELRCCPQPVEAMNFWNRLFHALGVTQEKRTFSLDEQTVLTLQNIARREKRTEEEVAADLIAYALTQRELTDQYLSRWQALSPREQEVAALTCLNYTNAEIAAALTISPETVKTHIHNVLAKFELRRKSELRSALAGWDFSAWEKRLG
jgi:DNA-binding CsgD family transcriptional regulator